MAKRKSKTIAGLRFRDGFWHIQKQVNKKEIYGNTGCRRSELEKAKQILQERIAAAKADRIVQEKFNERQRIIEEVKPASRSDKSEKTYGEVAEEFLNTALHPTISDDQSIHNKLIREIKGIAYIPLQKLNRNHISQFLKELKVDGRSNRTLDGYIKFINKLKNLAATSYQFEDGTPYIEHPNTLPLYCKKNAHLYGVGFKNDERQPIILNDDQIELMFDSFENREFSDLIMFLLMTGARCGEVLGLRWDEEALVDQNGIELQPKLKGRIFKIGDRVGENKGNGRRFLFLNKTAKKILDRQRGKDSEFVFIFSASGSHPKRHLGKYSQSRQEHYGTDVIARNSRLTRYRDWTLAKKALGLPIVIKDLRSTFASHLRDNDVHLFDEKDILGHIVGDVTRRYAQANWLKLVQIVDRVFPNDPRQSHLKIVNG